MKLIEETKSRKELMAYLTATATADCEADVDALLRIFNPVKSRYEMGHVFYETLGYNPIIYYDFTDVMAVLDDALEHVSTDGVNIITARKDAIVLRAQEIYESRRDNHLKEAVAIALAEYLGDKDASAISYYLTGSAVPTDDGDDDDEELELSSDLDLDSDADLDDLDELGEDDEDTDFEFEDDDDD